MAIILYFLQYDDLVNNYYTPFIKSKLDKDKINFDKQLKELSKEQDRIKTAYIKGVVDLNDFDEELKHIEFQRKEINKKKEEQKQYESLEFTIDDLTLFKDKQTIEQLVNPQNMLDKIVNWFKLSREEKQSFIFKYIDNIEIKKLDDKIEIVNVNFRKTLINDFATYHIEHKIPYDISLFVDANNVYVPIQQGGFKTKKQAKEYTDKLRKFYDITYYETTFDEAIVGCHVKSDIEIEKFIRIIPLQDKRYHSKEKLELGLIGVNLSNVRLKNGEQFYKGMLKNDCKEVV